MMDGLRAVYRFITWPVTQVVEKTVEIPIKPVGGLHIKIAGVLGAAAIAALAYSEHGKFSPDEGSEQRRHTFKNGANIHVLNSLALLGVPASRFPRLVKDVSFLKFRFRLHRFSLWVLSYSPEPVTTPLFGMTVVS